MLRGTRKRWGRIFKERQLLLRTADGVRHLRLSGWLQAVGVMAALGVALGFGYFLLGYWELKGSLRQLSNLAAASEDAAARTADELRRELQALRAQQAAQAAAADERYAAAVADTGRAREALTAVLAENEGLRTAAEAARTNAAQAQALRDGLSSDLDRAEASLAAALTQGGSEVAELTRDLDGKREELRRTEAERAGLRQRALELEAKLAAAAVRAEELKRTLEAKERELKETAAERDRLRAARDEAARLGSLEAPPRPALKPPVPIRDGGSNGGNRVRTGLARVELEAMLSATGLDVDRMLGRVEPAGGGEGGPFVALDARTEGRAAERQRLAVLHKLVTVLPLAAPLADYQFESGFGPRRDPINGRLAFHPGLDLSAAYRAPVLATAPGQVRFAGWRSQYGNVVEIDHGHGIVTRYAHLRRILVAVGRGVGLRQEIGELGSTGRSTGPHVHYEVLVDGVAQDPQKFIEVGKNVVQVAGK